MKVISFVFVLVIILTALAFGAVFKRHFMGSRYDKASYASLEIEPLVKSSDKKAQYDTPGEV